MSHPRTVEGPVSAEPTIYLFSITHLRLIPEAALGTPSSLAINFHNCPLPLTPNGKLDRKALPAPDAIEGGSKLPYAAPENDLEQTLVQLWQEVLGLERVGTQDNFFDVGGHSLLVVKLHRELRTRIDQPVAFTDLYRFPTIRFSSERLTASGPSETLQASSARAKRRRDALARRRGRDPKG